MLNRSLQYTVPVSIVVAGGLIALAVVLSGGAGSGSSTNQGGFGNNLSPTAENIQPVSENDHIRGSISAPVTIVEFSDLECPFCKRLHPTLSQIVDEFDGQVKWVYRHFPLTSIHSNALASSLASECVAELGGNDAFWSFIDGAFETQGNLGDPLYEQLAISSGVSLEAFQTCYQEQRHRPVVDAQYENALASGGRGTPFVVVLNEKGEPFPFSGALPYGQIRQIIESAIASS